MQPITMLAATSMLGYGFTEAAFRGGLARDPDFIAADAGSMDPGPHYLGAGTAYVSRAATKRDLGLMVEAGIGRRIPGSSRSGNWVNSLLMTQSGHHFKT